jgi:uncharacterized paraquat-inducible protein A
MSKRNIVSLVLSVISLGFLVPGLFYPILSIDIGAKIPLLGEISLHNTKQSIVETIQSLFKNGNQIVAFLIFLFSILVPVVKAIALFVAIFTRNENLKGIIGKLLGIIGKWSMADVFIVAIFIAFLSTSSEDSINAGIHSGFYYFLVYCILSILAFQFLKVNREKV